MGERWGVLSVFQGKFGRQVLPTAQNTERIRPGEGLDSADKVTGCFDFTTSVFWQVVTAARKQSTRRQRTGNKMGILSSSQSVVPTHKCYDRVKFTLVTPDSPITSPWESMSPL